MRPSHYDVLGVPPSATAEAIRRAYRQRARELHPDRQSGDAGNGRAMQEINEAWRVLGDAARRTAYDRSLTGGRGAAGEPGAEPAVDPEDRPFAHPMAHPGDVGISVVRGLPWVAVVVVLLAIFVFTAFAGGDDDEAPSASQLIGSCVELEPGGVVTTVPCTGPSDGRVDLVVVRSSQCPAGSDVARLPGESTWLCLRDPSPAGG